MKILLIRRENVCYGSLDFFLDGLKSGLEACGAEVEELNISAAPTALPDDGELYRINQARYDAAIAFNAVGQQNYIFNGGNFWDDTGVYFINYIVDHPLQHTGAMLKHGNSYCVICVDKVHAEFVKKFYPHVRDVCFLPLGAGTCDAYGEYEHTDNNFEAKDIDVLFTGTYIPLSLIEKKINDYPTQVKKLIIRHIEYMLDHRNISEEEGLVCVLRDMGIEPEEIDLTGYMFATKLTEEYVKFYSREETIRYLIDSGIKLRIYGNNWDIFEADMKNTVCYKGVDYKALNKLYLRSKIVFDHSSHFRFGMHDRIPSAMLAGAAVVTDENPYLRSIFKEGLYNGELCMYNITRPDEAPDITADMLTDTHRLYEMTVRAGRKASTDFTWKARAGELLDMIYMKGIGR